MSGQSTPRSGIGSSGALGSSSAGSVGADWARAGIGIASPQAAAASRNGLPRPIAPDTMPASVATAPERRQCEPMKLLVHGALRFVGGKRVDQPLNLSPVAEFDDVVGAPALLGADRGLQCRLAAILADQLLGVGKAAAAGNEERVHALAINSRRLRRHARTGSTKHQPCGTAA